MPDTLRGQAAIVGIGELKPERTRPGRNAMSLLAEAAYLAIQDAGLTKGDIDGMILEPELSETGSGFNPRMAEYMGIFPSYYEPWGYTPMESIAMGVPAVTTDLSGFGAYVERHLANSAEHGVYVLNRGKQDFGNRLPWRKQKSEAEMNAALAQQFYRFKRIQWIDFDQFMLAPEIGFASALKHLQVGEPESAARTILAGPTLHQYAKAPSNPFNARLYRS